MLFSASFKVNFFVEHFFTKYHLDDFGIQRCSQEFFAKAIKLLSKEQIAVTFFLIGINFI